MASLDINIKQTVYISVFAFKQVARTAQDGLNEKSVF